MNDERNTFLYDEQCWKIRTYHRFFNNSNITPQGRWCCCCKGPSCAASLIVLGIAQSPGLVERNKKGFECATLTRLEQPASRARCLRLFPTQPATSGVVSTGRD
eukprot:scaffold258082_cov18-Prasinocladus_malaysianus.AAC.1